MPLSDFKARALMSNCLRELANEINNPEYPIGESGTEYIAQSGWWTNQQTGERRYWLSCLLTAKNPDEITRLKKVLNLRFHEKNP